MDIKIEIKEEPIEMWPKDIIIKESLDLNEDAVKKEFINFTEEIQNLEFENDFGKARISPDNTDISKKLVLYSKEHDKRIDASLKDFKNFKCNFRDFSWNWKNGLNSHLLDNDIDSELSSLLLSSSESCSSLEDLLEDLLLSQENSSETIYFQSDGDWKELGTLRDQFPFTGNRGVKISDEIEARDVLEIFESIVTDNIIHHICNETNKYANSTISKHKRAFTIKKRSKMHDWKDVSKEEMRLFEGLLLLMGIIDKPTIQLYFTRKPLLKTPIFYETMKQDRLMNILKFLHFSSSSDSTNKLCKVDELLQLYKDAFKSAYVPSQDISIDESLLLWKGRLSWKMYIPLKRAKQGIKLYMLCEAKTGYVYDFIIYVGKGTQIPVNLPDIEVEKQSHSTKVILSLVADLLDKGYFLGIDNYYSSLFLFDYLASHKTDVIGTVMKNRKGLPQKITSGKLKKGQTFVMYRRKTMLMRWKDKKDIFIMSTIHDGSMQSVSQKGGLKKLKPTAYVDYKGKMSGMDIMDQLLSATNIARKHLKKYYKTIYLRFLDICVLNSHVIHKKLGGELSLFAFKLQLITDIFSKYGTSTEKHTFQGKPSTIPTPSRLTGRHFLEGVPVNEKGNPKRRKCVVCTARKKRTQVAYLCKQCQVPLCVTECFEIYHTKINF